MAFQFMNFSALGKTEVDQISALKCNEEINMAQLQKASSDF